MKNLVLDGYNNFNSKKHLSDTDLEVFLPYFSLIKTLNAAQCLISWSNVVLGWERIEKVVKAKASLKKQAREAELELRKNNSEDDKEKMMPEIVKKNLVKLI